MKTFVMGDIHGNFKALKQCLVRSKFNKEKNRLMVLGDVCDGYPETKQCIEELLTIKDLIYVIGNHDLWFLEFIVNGCQKKSHPDLTQGGYATIQSYQTKFMCPDEIEEYEVPKSHANLLRNSYAYFVDDKNRIFVHGGFDIQKDIKDQHLDLLTWDRDLFYKMWERHYHGKSKRKFSKYDEIFIGHTITECRKTTDPIHVCNLWNLDTGCGWGGKLTLLNVDTKEYWQSDLSQSLYPNKGRK